MTRKFISKFLVSTLLIPLTRTKTSIRYAKENDREKERERKKGRRRDIEREGEIERKRGERVREVKTEIITGNYEEKLLEEIIS